MNIKTFYRKYFEIKDPPFDHQEKIWELLHQARFPIFLKAPTGSGKTEAVIAPFLNQFVEKRFTIAPRMIYVLPMRVLVDSIAERIRVYSKKISSNISVAVQHGDVPNSPFFISHIVVTTLDQFIYAFARASNQVGRHLDIPAGAIASSLVVFDEAHMYRDGFTFSMMRALMEIIYESKIPFIVMTATMPESLEKSLFENITIKDDCQIFSNAGLRGQVDLSIQRTPIYKNGEVSIPGEILCEIKAKKTLIVLNQVERAKRVYEYLKNFLDEEEELVLLHSRFTVADRKKHENKAIKQLENQKKGVVVSTQVLEAGMDVSANLLLTELAPADALIQRAGRCARYEGEQGEMFIFPTENHYPYEREHQQKTFEWLENNQLFNIRDFIKACSFVNLLDYKADDFAARDSLVDLYETVLYADSRPQNIQVRDGKLCYLLVVDLATGEGRKQEEKIRSAVLKTDFRQFTINVDIGVAWDLHRQGILKWELEFDEEGQPRPTQVNQIAPFRTYILDSNFYDPSLGVKEDEAFVI